MRSEQNLVVSKQEALLQVAWHAGCLDHSLKLPLGCTQAGLHPGCVLYPSLSDIVAPLTYPTVLGLKLWELRAAEEPPGALEGLLGKKEKGGDDSSRFQCQSS